MESIAVRKVFIFTVAGDTHSQDAGNKSSWPPAIPEGRFDVPRLSKVVRHMVMGCW